jgi:hypothetical protein
MERPIGSVFPMEGKIIEVVYDEFNRCSECIFDPERCDEISWIRGTCCNRLYPVIFQEKQSKAQ